MNVQRQLCVSFSTAARVFAVKNNPWRPKFTSHGCSPRSPCSPFLCGEIGGLITTEETEMRQYNLKSGDHKTIHKFDGFFRTC
jgi:hypothetical protein